MPLSLALVEIVEGRKVDQSELANTQDGGEPEEFSESLKATPSTGLQEQPGGRVGTADGKPWGVVSIQAEIDGAYSWLQKDYGWLSVLAQAAIYYGATGDNGRKARVITAWGDSEGSLDDKEKHDAFTAHVRAGLDRCQPWLWPMFEAAGATLVMGPGFFAFTVPTMPSAQFDCPGAVPLTTLVPFVENGETAH